MASSNNPPKPVVRSLEFGDLIAFINEHSITGLFTLELEKLGDPRSRCNYATYCSVEAAYRAAKLCGAKAVIQP